MRDRLLSSIFTVITIFFLERSSAIAQFKPQPTEFNNSLVLENTHLFAEKIQLSDNVREIFVIHGGAAPGTDAQADQEKKSALKDVVREAITRWRSDNVLINAAKIAELLELNPYFNAGIIGGAIRVHGWASERVNTLQRVFLNHRYNPLVLRIWPFGLIFNEVKVGYAAEDQNGMWNYDLISLSHLSNVLSPAQAAVWMMKHNPTKVTGQPQNGFTGNGIIGKLRSSGFDKEFRGYILNAWKIPQLMTRDRIEAARKMTRIYLNKTDNKEYRSGTIGVIGMSSRESAAITSTAGLNGSDPDRTADSHEQGAEFKDAGRFLISFSLTGDGAILRRENPGNDVVFGLKNNSKLDPVTHILDVWNKLPPDSGAGIFIICEKATHKKTVVTVSNTGPFARGFIVKLRNDFDNLYYEVLINDKS